ncbi:MAG TPA: peptidoglycan recognition family protein [Anaerolineae bacterium]|nr:peptidoglycan recognition family protein [Anaerolineae bacterium]
MSETTLTLQSPSRSGTWPLSVDLALYAYAPTRELIDRAELTPGIEVGAWLDDQTRQITSLQILPPFAGPHGFPDSIQQPAPTGETREFGPLTLITRAGWGAALPHLQAPAEHGLFDPANNPEGWLMYQGSLTNIFNTAVVHHSALPLADGPQPIQRAHLGLKGYADIGYHFLIDGLGNLYEGRTLRARGAHTGGHNTGTVGIVLLGNFNVVEPFTRAWQTLQDLIAYLRDVYHLTHVAGHHDFQPEETECPGARLRQRLPALTAELGMKLGTDGYVIPEWIKRDRQSSLEGKEWTAG